MLNKRTSAVDRVIINSLSIVSTFEVGDSSQIQAFSRAIALQRERQTFFSNEIKFSDFDIFTETIPVEPIFENVSFETNSVHPIIKVGFLDITGVSTSSIIHIGNTKNINMESRIKHIRHLHPRN
ncbi:spore germination protein GerPE [Robertmurraya sp. DFI.2.37]|uniref:spore germination protein GerPE n=1 Tax=Robertmurraya sp. DFI.2.37 TaxID=3031819 RepID=UPI001247EC1C|nr:spore germination protein GerPE [Robertmurraya sp. DFI.2.37]MDF1507380.1 spore germination protein GerPE [Robertmurraya sp. DFI.2.37]